MRGVLGGELFCVYQLVGDGLCGFADGGPGSQGDGEFAGVGAEIIEYGLSLVGVGHAGDVLQPGS